MTYVASSPGVAEPFRPASADSVSALAREIASLRKQMRKASAKPSLTHSAIDDGALITTADGMTAAVFGSQYDGSNGVATLTGPVPPVPNAPVVETVVGGVAVTWDGGYPDQGGFTSPVVAPMDFARVRIDVSADPNFTGDVKRNWISSPSGGRVMIPWAPTGTPLYARLVTVSVPGKLSLPSLVAGPVNSGLVGLSDLGFNIADYAGGTTIFYGPTTPVVPEGGHTMGDLWLKEIGTSTGAAGQPPAGTKLYETRRWDGDSWELIEAQGVSDALANAILAQQAADSKAKPYYQDTAPAHTGPAGSGIWFETDAGNKQWSWSGTAWVARTLGNGSITPNSLVASNVIATGTVTAALLEATLVLATTLIAGSSTGAHARMNATGFRVYREDPDGSTTPEEVVRMGTETNDYFGIVDSTGDLVGSWDDTGVLSAAGANVNGNLNVRGKELATHLNEAQQPAGSYRKVMPVNVGGAGYGYYGKSLPTGITEVNGFLVAGHRYQIDWQLVWTTSGAAGTANDEMVFGMVVGTPTFSGSNSASAPLATGTKIEQWLTTTTLGGGARWVTASGSTKYTAASTGRHRFLLTGQAGQTNVADTLVIADSRFPVSMDISSLGIAKPDAGAISQGGVAFAGGTTPAAPGTPVQQYDTGWLAPAGWTTVDATGATRQGEAGPVQGWDPSGVHGDGSGWWWWTLPSITGTVDEVWVWLYSSHWYYNSGGTARIGAIKNGAVHPIENWVVGAQTDFPGWPKPGSKQIDISGWRNLFHNNQGSNRAIGVSVGRIGSTNLTYYGKFDGPSARLRLKYTQ